MSDITDDELSVSKVYDILKSGKFLGDLYWDVLSVIKDKVCFLSS